MASRIQGITVEIGGDTTKLSSALSGVNKEIKNTQSQLKDVEKLLKLDPTNTELLAQKQRLLGDREEGSAGSVTRIRWWVYYDESNYSGGITGVGWFRKSHNDPFTDGMPATGPFEGIEESDIWETANGPAGNLDNYFNAWNASASSSQILEFQLYLVDYASDCITVGGMGG